MCTGHIPLYTHLLILQVGHLRQRVTIEEMVKNYSISISGI